MSTVLFDYKYDQCLCIQLTLNQLYTYSIYIASLN